MDTSPEEAYESLPEDVKKRARACKSPEELVELACNEGVELSDAELESIAGGWDIPCHDDVPGCGSYTSE